MRRGTVSWALLRDWPGGGGVPSQACDLPAPQRSVSRPLNFTGIWGGLGWGGVWPSSTSGGTLGCDEQKSSLWGGKGSGWLPRHSCSCIRGSHRPAVCQTLPQSKGALENLPVWISHGQWANRAGKGRTGKAGTSCLREPSGSASAMEPGLVRGESVRSVARKGGSCGAWVGSTEPRSRTPTLAPASAAAAGSFF